MGVWWRCVYRVREANCRVSASNLSVREVADNGPEVLQPGDEPVAALNSLHGLHEGVAGHPRVGRSFSDCLFITVELPGKCPH